MTLTAFPQPSSWPMACEIDDDGPCISPAAYTVAVEDDDGELSDIVAAAPTCGFHLQDAVDEALDLPAPAGVDADEYLTDHERRVIVTRWA